jgi:hypothetical protein
MLPGWIEKILESAGILGAIIFVLLVTIVALVAYIKQMQAKADKVYGYRLAERDAYNKVVSDAQKVLEQLIETTNERNELTREQAELLSQQIHAFDLLKATILGQYENIKDISHATSTAVSSMAESVRTLSAQISESKYAYTLMLTELKAHVSSAGSDIADEVKADLRSQLGSELTIVKRKRTITQTRPGGKS